MLLWIDRNQQVLQREMNATLTWIFGSLILMFLLGGVFGYLYTKWQIESGLVKFSPHYDQEESLIMSGINGADAAVPYAYGVAALVGIIRIWRLARRGSRRF